MKYVDYCVPNVTITELDDAGVVINSYKINTIGKYMEENYGDEKVLLLKVVVEDNLLNNLLTDFKGKKYDIVFENYYYDFNDEIITNDIGQVRYYPNMFLRRNYKTKITEKAQSDRVLVFSTEERSFTNINRIIDRDQNEQLRNAIRSRRERDLYTIETYMKELSKSGEKIASALKSIESKIN
ncbi:hypothetical protein [Clostridium paraputrificum]|uniref:hypothetical protein n=1 Tax=Clostridium paraputrificum TaxID=29363 RepID=UPI00189E8F90|nr:hypothetical protein [Clostridium paraputrificum]